MVSHTLSILKNWNAPDLLRQCPGTDACLDGVRVTVDRPDVPADLVVVLNRLNEPVEVTCPPDNLWLVIQEPPIGSFDRWHDGTPEFARIYSSDPGRRSPRHRPCPGYLPWHVDRSYDQLKAMAPPEKPKRLSAVISAKAHLPGHKERLAFVRSLEPVVPFDLYGRGHRPLDDKWDGLAPYRYSLAIENFSNALYWTEKIADCFLAWTMPIYHGCTAIEDFFPAEAMIRIDLADPDAGAIVQDAVESDRWQRNREAIAHARELVLDRYNLLTWLGREAAEVPLGAQRKIGLPGKAPKPKAAIEMPSIQERIRRRWRRGFS